MATSELYKMTARELCERLNTLAYVSETSNSLEFLDASPANADDLREAARRLSRYAPVKIDPEDEGTWPTEEGLEFWSVKRQEWLRDAPTRSELAEGLATYYRRINNENPEGE